MSRIITRMLREKEQPNAEYRIVFQHDDLLTKDVVAQMVTVINEMVYAHQKLIAAIPAIKEEAPLWHERDIRRQLSEGEGFILALIDGKVVGVVSFVSRKWDRYTSLSFKLFSVTARVRGKGIGKEMMTVLEDWGVENGCDTITCGVIATNAAAIRLYESEGLAPMRVIMGKTLR